MERLKRRDFLKMVGIALACPTQILEPKRLTHPVDILLDLGMQNGKLMREMRKYCDERICKSEFDSEEEDYLRVSNVCYQFDVHYLKTMCCYVGDIILLRYPDNFFMPVDMKVLVISLEQISNYNCMIRVRAVQIEWGIPLQLFILDDSNNVCVLPSLSDNTLRKEIETLRAGEGKEENERED